jgi:hypothetical protein
MNERGLTIIEAIPAWVYQKLIKIEDPRPWAGKLPYSHALPGEECLNAIGKGDSVTVEVSLRKGLRPVMELNGDVSFEVLSVSSEFIEGRMQIPAERPISDSDIVVRIPKWAIKDVSFADPKHEHLAELPCDKYPGWCLLDMCGMPLGVAGTYAVDACYIYREEPKILPDNETRTDRGWRISHHARPMENEDIYQEKVLYVPTCFALDMDDSWLPLIDSPIGSAFKKNLRTGSFKKADVPPIGITLGLEDDHWKSLLARATDNFPCPSS